MSILQTAISRKYHAVFSVVAIFAGCLLAVVAAYYKTPMNFFRAEGGMFQFVAHSTAAEQHNYLKWFFERSYHGHFTPLGFWLEFKATQIAGPCNAFWQWRQLIVLACIATVVFALVRGTAKSLRASSYAAASAAAAVTAIFIYQPLMADVLAWTFLVFQLVWMLLSALALFSLLKLIQEPARKRWIWAAVIFAYASMHAVGLGLATVVATSVILAILLLGIARGKFESFRSNKRTIALALSLLLVASLAHALCMILLNGPPVPPGSQPLRNAVVLPSLGLVAMELVAAVQSLFVSGMMGAPTNETIAAAWPFGLGIALLAISVIVHLARGAMRAPDSRSLTMFVLHTFGIASFLMCIALIAARAAFEPSTVGLNAFLNGSRYLVPICFTLLGTLTALASNLAMRARVQTAALFLGVAVAMFVANQQYRINLYPKYFPRNQISHGQAWKLIKATAQECRTAHLPIPNIPLAPLAQEFHDYNLRLFEPLLHDELNLPAQERCEFVEWPECRGPARARYEQAAPSLDKIIVMLDLEPSALR
jgi:hypothetical protein